MSSKIPLVLGGDLFQSTHPHSEDVKFFRRHMAMMREAGLPVYYIQGQHDFSDPPWPDALSEDLIWVNNKVFTVDTFNVFALDHMKPAQLQEALTKVPPECSVVLLHQLARQVFPLEGTWDFDVAWLPPHVNTAILGDYHQPIEFHWGADNLGFYTGSMHVQAIDEPKEKSFVVAGADSRGRLQIQRIPLVTRPYFRYPVNNEAELDALVRWLDVYNVDAEATARNITWDAIKRPVVEVPHLTSVKDVKSRLEAATSDKVHLWLKPFNVEMEQGPIEVSDTGTRASLESSLQSFIPAGSLDYDFVLGLLSQPSDLVFPAWRERLGVAKMKSPIMGDAANVQA